MASFKYKSCSITWSHLKSHGIIFLGMIKVPVRSRNRGQASACLYKFLRMVKMRYPGTRLGVICFTDRGNMFIRPYLEKLVRVFNIKLEVDDDDFIMNSQLTEKREKRAIFYSQRSRYDEFGDAIPSSSVPCARAR